MQFLLFTGTRSFRLKVRPILFKYLVINVIIYQQSYISWSNRPLSLGIFFSRTTCIIGLQSKMGEWKKIRSPLPLLFLSYARTYIGTIWFSYHETQTVRKIVGRFHNIHLGDGRRTFRCIFGARTKGISQTLTHVTPWDDKTCNYVYKYN